MVAVGVEELGVDEFVQGQFFDGEVYVDVKKQIYKDMGYKRYSFMSVMKLICSRKAKDAANEAKSLKIQGNLKGDGYQNGGILIVKPDNEVLLDYKQENAAETIQLDEILKVLGISASIPATGPTGGAPMVECDEQACSIKK